MSTDGSLLGHDTGGESGVSEVPSVTIFVEEDFSFILCDVTLYDGLDIQHHSWGK